MTERQLALDHIVIGCVSLDQGAAYIRDTLGAEMPLGGKHPHMGTHNRLMRVGDTAYLELIAIDPEAPSPRRPRWYALDDLRQQARLAERPRPIVWIASTRDIAATLAASPVDLGRATPASRGDLTWQISGRDDGILPENGLLPGLIEWSTGVSPMARMADLGVKLTELRLVAPDPAALGRSLDALGAAHLVTLARSDTERRIEIDLRRADGSSVTLR
jgi:hypothetical protein